MRLKLELPDSSGTLRVTCIGEISQSRFAGTNDPLLDLLGIEGFARRILLDLERVDYIDSSGVGWLVGSLKRFKERGGELVLFRVPPIVEQVLRFCGLENHFHIQND